MFKNKNTLNVCKFSARVFRQRIHLYFTFISTGKLVLNYAGLSGRHTWLKCDRHLFTSTNPTLTWDCAP